MWKRKINIWDKMFYVNLDTVKRDDNLVTEINIDEVEVMGYTQYKDEPMYYGVVYKGMNKTAEEKDLFWNKEAAIKAAKQKRNAIEIYFNGDNIKTL